jgi:hypothetical protein
MRPAAVDEEAWKPLRWARYRVPVPETMERDVDRGAGHDDFLMSSAKVPEVLASFIEGGEADDDAGRRAAGRHTQMRLPLPPTCLSKRSRRPTNGEHKRLASALCSQRRFLVAKTNPRTGEASRATLWHGRLLPRKATVTLHASHSCSQLEH